MNWKQTKNGYLSFNKDFESFDLAWEFMGFLAKLSRSTGLQPTIINRGNTVEIAVCSGSDHKSFTEGVTTYFTDEESTSVESATTPNGFAKLYTDGGSRGNPGPSASGFVLYDEFENEIARGGKFLGVTTNNQAEYQSLKMGIDKALELKLKSLKVSMDSMLVVNQIKGVYKVRNRDLWPVFESLKTDIQKFNSFVIVHVPRELNKVADSIVNEVLDENIKS